MSRHVFDWKQDEEFGTYGWILRGCPHFNSTRAGRTVAHDVLEHFKPKHGGLTDEMLAFGAMVWGRVQGGWFYSLPYEPNPVQHLSSDLSGFLNDHYCDPHTHSLLDPGVTCRIDHDVEEEIEVALRMAVEKANSEYADEETGDLFTMDATVEHMRGWIRRGYRAAAQRYKGRRPEQLCYLFDALAERINRHHQHSDEGEELVITIDPRAMTFETVQR